MNHNFQLALISAALAVVINVLMYGFTTGAIGAFFTAFGFCIILFIGIDWFNERRK